MLCDVLVGASAPEMTAVAIMEFAIAALMWQLVLRAQGRLGLGSGLLIVGMILLIFHFIYPIHARQSIHA